MRLNGVGLKPKHFCSVSLSPWSDGAKTGIVVNGCRLKFSCAALIKDMKMMLTDKPSKQIF